jgi:hypothetical protein
VPHIVDEWKRGQVLPRLPVTSHPVPTRWKLHRRKRRTTRISLRNEERNGESPQHELPDVYVMHDHNSFTLARALTRVSTYARVKGVPVIRDGPPNASSPPTSRKALTNAPVLARSRLPLIMEKEGSKQRRVTNAFVAVDLVSFLSRLSAHIRCLTLEISCC